MPYADNPDLSHLIRTLLYGKAKAKKTWWALRCASLGFNVILLNGDDGAQIVAQMPAEAKKRILIVDLVNTQTRAVFSEFMVQFCKPGNKFYWDEQDKCVVPGVKSSTHSFIQFNPELLTPNDVVVIDSWTALAWGMRFSYAREHKIDLTDAERTDWDGYGFEGRFLDYILNYIHALPCHVIVIGHATVYEKRSKDGKTIISQETIPISSSGPAGIKLAKHFSDVLFFDRISPTVVKIRADGDSTRDGGSRLLAPQTYDWDTTGPELLFNAVNCKSTGKPCDGAVWYASGADIGKKPSVESPARQEVPRAVDPGPIDPPKSTVISMPSTASKVVDSPGGGLLARLKAAKGGNMDTK